MGSDHGSVDAAAHRQRAQPAGYARLRLARHRFRAKPSRLGGGHHLLRPVRDRGPRKLKVRHRSLCGNLGLGSRPGSLYQPHASAEALAEWAQQSRHGLLPGHRQDVHLRRSRQHDDASAARRPVGVGWDNLGRGAERCAPLGSLKFGDGLRPLPQVPHPVRRLQHIRLVCQRHLGME